MDAIPAPNSRMKRLADLIFWAIVVAGIVYVFLPSPSLASRVAKISIALLLFVGWYAQTIQERLREIETKVTELHKRDLELKGQIDQQADRAEPTLGMDEVKEEVATQISTVRTGVEDLRAELKEYLDESADGLREELRQSTDGLREELQEGELDYLWREVDILTEDLTALRADLRDRLGSLKDSVGELDTRVENLKTELESLRSELDEMEAD